MTVCRYTHIRRDAYQGANLSIWFVYLYEKKEEDRDRETGRGRDIHRHRLID